MFSVEDSEKSIFFKFSAEMKLVDRAVKETKDFLAAAGMEGGFSNMKLVLRELLINAVEHGCSKRPEMQVRCKISLPAKELCAIEVEDDGPGFAWKSLDPRLPEDPAKIRNRGFPLVNTLADKIEFNEKGNAVKAFMTMKAATGYAVEEDDDGWRRIVPSGDITAASSDALRELLATQIAQGMRACRFDFARVADIDSVGLSSLIVLSRTLAELGEKPPRLEVVNAPKDIKRLFEMTMLDSIYKLRD